MKAKSPKIEIPMQPIKYTRDQVALMVLIGMAYVPNYAREVGVSQAKAELVAKGLADASPSILMDLNLVPDGDGYLWDDGGRLSILNL